MHMGEWGRGKDFSKITYNCYQPVMHNTLFTCQLLQPKQTRFMPQAINLVGLQSFLIFNAQKPTASPMSIYV